MNDPKYSVLMAVYEKDTPEWVALAIDSMLQQTVKPDEMIIVADGPLTESLYQVIASKITTTDVSIKTVQLEENKGLGEALRIGVLACSNDWIVRMDADDYAKPDRCAIQFEMQNQYRADMVGCDVDEFVGDPRHVVARRVFPEFHEDIVRFGKRRTPFSHPGIMMRKSRVLSAGNYRSAYLHEDYDLFVRMLMDGCIGYNVKRPLVCMRVSPDFYARRGGLKYLIVLLKCNVKFYRLGWMRTSDFLVRSVANSVTCLVPNGIRDFIYKKCLRKQGGGFPE